MNESELDDVSIFASEEKGSKAEINQDSTIGAANKDLDDSQGLI